MLLNLMAKSSGGGSPPITVNFTNAQLVDYFNGYFDVTTNTARRRFYTSHSTFTAYVRGTQARLFCGGGGSPIIPFSISIDGGAETIPTITGGVLTLFTGLTDTLHLVQIRCTSANDYNGGNWVNLTGNVLEVTGVNPEVTKGPDLGTVQILADPAFSGIATGLKRPFALSEIPTPSYLPKGFRSTGYNVHSAVKIRAKADCVWIFTGDTSFYVGIDGAYPTLVNISGFAAGIPTWRKVLSGQDLNNFHDYLIIANGDGSTVNLFSASPQMVMISGTGHAYAPVTSRKTVLQVGDSITETRINATTMMGTLDLYKWTNALGITGIAVGKIGQTTSGYNTDWSTITPQLPFIPDYALIALGANDTAGAALETQMTTMVNNLLTLGVTKIAIRCVATVYGTAKEQNLINVVNSFANPNIIYVGGSQPTAGTNLWTGIGTIDGLHPNEAGYVTYANYEQSALSSFFTP